ncbi:hypothetical protein ACF3NT_02545 [Naumannella halotolerans]|uniref:Uncharacterized protein n=1 Tax=Naumannella halotolerans TaxID=993414 RepID=A0A4R7J6R9_9ACTN|nr:hypothetical protein [Naumannella halotolerans]TDT32944.1 hypothetical protein CLV29_0535 [Naumannella halotolerans]
MTELTVENVASWCAQRLPEEWQLSPAEIAVDRDEITIWLSISDLDSGADLDADEAMEAREIRTAAFRDETRGQRIEIAQETERHFGVPVSWGLQMGDHRELWTHVSAPVMTRLRQPQRQVLDTLVSAGVARSRADALAWCVRLVGQHEGDWLAELREAIRSVDQVRDRGPRA